ncbi:tetratricopeptide repeat protein [Lichenibacterium dinghuense]|uniref:tetratricopeptide repeat protein n=1 Tax=Lichenibacterium dinghuense TaxID=2895977 RepID=UPI001F1BF594|nr:tetratricopeptide repeat protein [Lichenibacterium sp. 6Y81]
MPDLRSSPRTAARLAAVLLAGTAFAVTPALARDVIAMPPPPDVSGSVSGNYLSALVAGADRDTQAASAYFKEVLRSDPRNPELIERTFVASLANGDIDDALDFARRMVKTDPKNGLAHMVLGIGQMKDGHWVAARREFLSGGGGNAHDVTATLLTAWTFAGQGDEKKGLAAIDDLKDTGFRVFRDYHAALIADLANDLPEATKRFKTAYAEDHTILRLVDAYARFEARHGAKDEALRALDAFGQVLPHHPQVEALQADIRADKPVQPLIRTAQEGAAEVLYGLGAAGGRQGDELAAMIYLRLSLYLAPNNNLAQITLADLYARLKQNEQAIAVYSKVPDASALRNNADVQTGLTLDVMGKPDDAIRYLKDIVAKHPHDLDALTTLGNVEREQKQYAEAAATYGQALDSLPKDDKAAWTLLYFRGISYERAHEWPKAEADFQRALQLEPDQPLVLNYLGYSWVDRGEHLDEAFAMLRKAVALRPEDGFIVDSLGWADYKLGDYEGAVKELEKAIALKPGDPTINDHLGDAYWRTGHKLEAQFQWNHARDLKPEPDDLPAILDKIAHGLPDPKPTAAAEAKPAPAAPPAAPTPAPTPDPAPAAAPAGDAAPK